MQRHSIVRRLPVGAEPLNNGVHFRVWAPAARRARVVWVGGDPPLELKCDERGYFEGFAHHARAGMDYFLRLDDERSWPDPASRFQPEGPRGPSRIVNASDFAWSDGGWPGIAREQQVLYELHVGTFTPAGTWAAAGEQLSRLSQLGITALELMPVAEFAGAFGWSYDGVQLFAPSRLYGTPDDMRRFVDEAHRLRMGVILDVVYNHFSTLGEEVLRPFSSDYFSSRHENEWGAAVNFDSEPSAPVREFFLANVHHWIAEYHLDGLRVDATQAFFDTSPRHILLEIGREARAAAGPRRVLVVGENEPQRSELLRSAEQGGCEFDALWNDDFHHTAAVRLTGCREGYYTDYHGMAGELLASVKWGYLFQGQRYAWQDKTRGTPALDIEAKRFINYLENHDQVANSASGARLHQRTSPGRYRTMTALWLLAPQTPMFFQGQEFASSRPFLYFNDCGATESENVARGRAKFLSQFPSLAREEVQSRLPHPCERATFARSKLDPGEHERHAAAVALHRDLLRLRREDSLIRRQDATNIHGGQFSDDALFLRYLSSSGDTRLLIVNFGAGQFFESVSHPLLAPPRAARWQTSWSSEDPRYGGSGTAELDTKDGWRIPGEAAVLLTPVPCESSP